MKTFYEWVTDKYRLKNGGFRDSFAGDLAGDISRDKEFPRESTDPERLKQYFGFKIRDDEIRRCAFRILREYRQKENRPG